METLVKSEIFLLAFTCGIYVLALALYNRTRLSLLHPLLTSAFLIIVFLSLFRIDYREYDRGTRLVQFLLGPSVVALGYVLYEQVEHIRRNWVSILTAVVTGSAVGIVSVILIARSLGADETVVASLEPKSVTTPIAMGIAERSGGIPSLTSVVVILVGIFGGIVAPFVLNRLHVKSKVARGLAMGAAAHGIGTSKAVELGAVEGAVSGLAIGLMGLVTALLVPLIETLL